MFAYLEGRLVTATPPDVILDIHGIGYRITVPISTLGSLPSTGSTIKLYTTYVVRDTGHQLFGFLTPDARDLFELLTGISGVGPKLAIAVLGHLTVNDLHIVTQQRDAASLSKVPGIGKKSAERILLELQDKLKINTTASPTLSAVVPPHIRDATSALVNLGYSPPAAAQMLEKTLKQNPDITDLATLITTTLQQP